MNSKLKHELYINLMTMAAATPAIMTGTSHPGGDFSPHPNVKYTLRNNANVRRVASRRTSIFIYHLLTKNIVGDLCVRDSQTSIHQNPTLFWLNRVHLR